MKGNKAKNGRNIILFLGFAVIVGVILAAVYTGVLNPSDTTLKVRKPAVSGSFYQSDKDKLSSDIDAYLNAAPAFPDVWGVKGLVSPHAGYAYSGPIAASGFKQLQKSRFETVIILGPSHHVQVDKAYIPDVDFFETPLGRVPISPKVKKMLGDDMFASTPYGADELEHSIEVQLPFLQKVLPPFKLIPVMVGGADPKKLADAILKYADDDTLIVASSDLSHFRSYDDCVLTDKRTTDAISGLDSDRMAREGDACGKVPVLALMEISKRRGWRTKLFDLRNSGDTAGGKNLVVGYSSIGFYDGLNPTEQETLLNLAQETLVKRFSGGEIEVDESQLPTQLLEEKGCFVTINKNGKLRGCIGHINPQGKLYRCVIENALNAAVHDPRFKPVEGGELGDLKFEVSVLTTPKQLKYDNPDDLLNKLIPGVDGVILESGWSQSTFLPAVWEVLPEKNEFLRELCLKQGSDMDCWKTADITTYQAQEFHQEGFE